MTTNGLGNGDGPETIQSTEVPVGTAVERDDMLP